MERELIPVDPVLSHDVSSFELISKESFTFPVVRELSKVGHDSEPSGQEVLPSFEGIGLYFDRFQVFKAAICASFLSYNKAIIYSTQDLPAVQKGGCSFSFMHKGRDFCVYKAS